MYPIAESELLQGKTIVFDGDSICQASSEGTHPNCGWAYRIGVKNHMNWYNFGVGGGTLTAELYSLVTGNARHWISRSIDTIHDNFSSLDYLILEGGTNDADCWQRALKNSVRWILMILAETTTTKPFVEQ